MSDNKDLISTGRLVVSPSNVKDDRDTDEDLGDENELLPNNLNKIQLLAGATVNLSTSSGSISVGAPDEEEVAGLSVDVPSKEIKDQRKMYFCKPYILLR